MRRRAGDKSAAKALMSGAGVPVVPGYHGEEQEEGRLQASAIGGAVACSGVCRAQLQAGAGGGAGPGRWRGQGRGWGSLCAFLPLQPQCLAAPSGGKSACS